jgi:phosphoribosylanthranilate isomerase
VRRVRVKMCGMTRKEDILHAIAVGVDAIGLIFYSKSPRCVSIETAAYLLKNVPAFVDAVAVFVNPDALFVTQLLDCLPIQLLQFHGDESPEFCAQFNRPYIKAVHPTSVTQIQKAALNYTDACALLLDTPSATSFGGSGQCFDWRVVPRQLDKPIILAGGLQCTNIQDAVLECKPYAIDVCSGIEASPGIKDHEKMTRLMNELGGAIQ